MKKMSIHECCNLIKTFKPATDKGRLLFITAEQEESIHKLAIALSKELSDDQPLPIYLTYGNIRGEHGWPFSRVRNNNRLRLTSDGTFETEMSGLIFPQDRPVIVLAEYFDWLGPNDQLAYAHMIDGGQEILRLYPGSILIAGIASTNRGHLAPGAADRGSHYELSE